MGEFFVLVLKSAKKTHLFGLWFGIWGSFIFVTKIWNTQLNSPIKILINFEPGILINMATFHTVKPTARFVRLQEEPKVELVCLIQFAALNGIIFNMWIDLKSKTSTERRLMAPFGWIFVVQLGLRQIGFWLGNWAAFFGGGHVKNVEFFGDFH